MTTNKQTDYFRNYKNVEVVESIDMGYCKVIGQLKNGQWAVWQTSARWGGNFTRPQRLPYGEKRTFESKEAAVSFAKKII